jgi:uncharacterized membrane protein YphA (DoxX/SURF4 family)
MSALRTVFVELPAWTWVGILLARLAVGSAFFLSGRGKLFVNERREQMRQTLREAHIPFPELNAVFVSTVEFVFGLLLVAGGGDAARLRHAGRLDDCSDCNDSSSND